jgi:hypothetical protein
MTVGLAVPPLPAGRRLPLEATDALLLGAFGLVAALGTATHCLLVDDGAVFLLAGWLGDAWDLFFRQSAARALSILAEFGPAWGARRAFGLTAPQYLVVAHLLYFLPPLLLWALIRRVEPHRVFSRLFLALSLVLAWFPSEFNLALGLWLAWLALVCDPARPAAAAWAATAGLGLALVFTHPAMLALSLLYLLAGGALGRLGRPLPRRSLWAAAAMTLLLALGYLATRRWLAPTNPAMVAAFALNARGFYDPRWWLSAFVYSPMLPALWLLLLAPGVEAVLRRRVPPLALAAVAAVGLWFALNGVGLATWIHARHTGGYAVALAAAMALAAPAAWAEAARRPLALFAGVATAAALSYAVDLALFERAVRQHLGAGYVAVDTLADWPAGRAPEQLRRTLFKWTAGPRYVPDVVVPAYDWFRVTTAVQTFFLSDREAVLYHHLPADYWRPFECPALERALAAARDDRDAALLRFLLGEGYCVR